MGKKPQPSEDELRFLIEMFKRNSTNDEILDAYSRSDFPDRAAYFVNERRRMYEAYIKVIGDGTSRSGTPLVTEAVKKHQEMLLDMLEVLLGGLSDVQPAGEQTYMSRSGGASIGREELSSRLLSQYGLLWDGFDDIQRLSFHSHMAESIPLVARMGYEEAAQGVPGRLLQELRTLHLKNHMDGTCDVCTKWQ